MTYVTDLPCNGCTSRSVGCHAECKQYKEFREMMDNLKRKKIKSNIERSALFRPEYYK